MFQVVDVVFPVSYALALGGLIWTTWRGARRPWVLVLAAVPLAGAVLDYAENILVRVALASYPDTGRAVLATSVTVTTGKLVLSYAAQALTVVGIVLAAVRWLRHRGARPSPREVSAG